MPSRRTPFYRLHKPSGQAVVTLNGRDFYLGKHNSKASRAEFDRLIGEWLTSGRQLPNDTGIGNNSIAELLVAYFHFAKRYYSKDGKPTKELVCMREAVRPLRKSYAGTPIKDFGPLTLKTLRQGMIEDDYCRTHINHQINRIRRVFKWGVENEWVPPSVLQSLQAVTPLKKGRTEARESKPVEPVSNEHVDATLPYVSRQVSAMIQLQRLTGMRPNEVARIRPCDIDTSENVWIYSPEDHKTAYRGHRRTIYFGPKGQEILRPWLIRRDDSFCFSPKEAELERNAGRRKERKSPMTPSQSKREPKARLKRPRLDQYSTASYRGAISHGIKKAGKAGMNIPHWHPHQLRHSCGTWMRKEFGLDVAQIILGHKSAQVTEVYAEVDRAKAIEVISKVG